MTGKASARIALGVILLACVTVRVAALPRGTGSSWDTHGFTVASEHLDRIAAGTYPSVYGARKPEIPQLGLPLVLRAAAPLAGETVKGGVLVALLAGTLSCLLAALLAERLCSPQAGLVAGVLVALDPTQVGYDTVVTSETLFKVLVLAGTFALARAGTLSLGAAAAGLAGLAGAWFTRATGMSLFGLGALFALARVERRHRLPVAAIAVALAAVVVLPAQHLRAKSGCRDYWRGNPLGSLYDEGRYPECMDVDAEGGTLLYVVDPPPVKAMLTENAGYFARMALRGALRALRLSAVPLALAAVALVAARRRGESLVASGFVLAVFALAVAFPIASLIHVAHMHRMVAPVSPLLHAVAAGGAVLVLRAALERLLARELPREGWRAASLASLAGLALAAASFDLRELPSLAGLGELGHPGSRWARARVFADEVKRATPEDARIGRGPNGDQALQALFSRFHVLLPSTTPQRFAGYLEKNGIAFVLHGDDPRSRAFLERMVAPRRLVPVARLAGAPGEADQVVSSIR